MNSGDGDSSDGGTDSVSPQPAWEEQVQLFAIVKLDDAGNVRGWNAGAESIKGYTADQILGRHFSRFYRAQDRERGLPAHLLAVARREGSAEDTGWRVRQDGSEFWARVTITAIHGSDGAVVGFVKIVRDLTPEKRIADEQVQLQRAFAHDLISPVTALRGYLDLLQEDVGSSNPLLGRAIEVSDHLTEMASALLRDAASQRAGEDRSTPLHLLVKSAAALVLRADAPRRVVFQRLDPVTIAGDVLALRRAIANIIENAAKYSDGSIEINVIDFDAVAEVSIKDHGRGIHPDDLLVITHEGIRGRYADPSDGGSGVGLASASNILTQHHGTMTIASTRNEGTTVTLRLPHAHI